MIKKIVGVFLTLSGVALLVFLLWVLLTQVAPDQYGISPHLSSKEIQAFIGLGLLMLVLLVSGILLLMHSRRKKIKGGG